MTSSWYEIVVDSDVPLTQGDIITDCPLLTWSEQSDISKQTGNLDMFSMLKKLPEAISADVIILSQSCDIEQNKLKDLILCMCQEYEKYKINWELTMKNSGKSCTQSAFINEMESIRKGRMVDRCILNSDLKQGINHRIVFFGQIYSLPKLFLEQFIVATSKRRFRLLSPYREYLSQSFARYFMRVGLPADVEKIWQMSFFCIC